MQNINVLLEKLMINRAVLLIKRADAELKEILNNDLKSYKAQQINFRNSSDNNRGTNMGHLVAWSTYI